MPENGNIDPRTPSELSYPMRSRVISYESAAGDSMSLYEMHTYLSRMLDEGINPASIVHVKTKPSWSTHGPGVKRVTVEEKNG